MTKKAGMHRRDTRAMRRSPRCGAKTRARGKCQAPAVSGKLRCRMHGGAMGSGAPKGNKNAYKHGLYTREALEDRKMLSELMRAGRKTLLEIK